MADPREPLGRLVHDTRCAHVADQAAAEGRRKFILGTWEERDDWQRELDMRIGSAVAAQAVHDAGLRNERLEAQVIALSTRLPVIIDALKIAIASGGYEFDKRDYRAVLAALGDDE